VYSSEKNKVGKRANLVGGGVMLQERGKGRSTPPPSEESIGPLTTKDRYPVKSPRDQANKRMARKPQGEKEKKKEGRCGSNGQ